MRPKPDLIEELVRGTAHGWSAVRLPHDTMIGQPRTPEGTPAAGYFAGGVWEYEKEFDLSEVAPGGRAVVEFEGVYRSARVYVNGRLAASHPYGYSNFHVRLDELAHDGETNRIRVEATARDDSRWYSGAGIYRPTWLITGGPLHIAVDGVRITTPGVDREATVVVIDTTIENDGVRPVGAQLRTELVDHHGRVVGSDRAPLTAPPGASMTAHQRIAVAAPNLWSVDDPNLYTCRSALVTDEGEVDDEVTTFGIRSVEVDSTRGLRINGQPVKLRGACIHHDNGVIGAATLGRAEERRVQLLKAAGFNALRSAHHPMSKAMLDACDRFGMLVMDEAFDAWTIAKVAEDYARWFAEWWERDVTAMVVKDFHRPSVILYSIGNEIPDLGHAGGAAQSRAMAELIRSIDPSRPVTNGINALLAIGTAALTDPLRAAAGDGGISAGAADGEMDINDMMTKFEQYLPVLLRQEMVDQKLAEASAALDVVGYNYADARYEMDHDLHPNRVIVGSETYPSKIDELWPMVTAMDHVIGDFTWTGWDYLGESGIGRTGYDPPHAGFGFLGPYPELTAGCGDIDITGFRRPISYLREIVFGRRSDPYIAVEPPEHYGRQPRVRTPWSTSGVASWAWPGHEGAPVRVTVYSDAEEVALLRNGVEVGRNPAGPAHRYRAEFDTRFEPGELLAIAYREGVEAGRAALRSPSGEVLLAVTPDRAVVRADESDGAFIDICLVDTVGTVVHGADREVSVDIVGPGELVGLGSGQPSTEESFLDPVHTTFDGRALAVVRPTAAGALTITVSAAGCTPVSARVEAR